MENKFLTYSKIIAWLSIAFCAISIGFFFLETHIEDYKLTTKINNILSSIDSPAGPIVVLNQDLWDMHTALFNLNNAAISEKAYFDNVAPGSTKKINNILDNIDNLTSSANETMSSANTAINKLSTNSDKISTNLSDFLITSDKTINNVNPLFIQMQKNLVDLDSLETDSNIKQMPGHINNLLDNSVQITGQTNQLLNNINNPHGILPWIAKKLW